MYFDIYEIGGDNHNPVYSSYYTDIKFEDYFVDIIEHRKKIIKQLIK